MNNLESSQNGTDNTWQQFGKDQNLASPMVDMANPNDMQLLARPSDNQNQSAVSNDGQLVFNNPYESGSNSGWQGMWNVSPNEAQFEGAQGGNGPSAILAGEVNSLASETNILANEVGAINQMDQGLAQPADSATTAPTDSTAPAQTNSATAVPIDSTAPAQTNSSTAVPTDATTSGQTNSSTAAPTDSTAPAQASAGQTSINDPLVTQLAQSGDPTLAGTLVDASSQLSSQGYAQLEQYIGQNYSGPANDNQLMNEALTQAGLSTSDESALQNVLQTDMPQALTAGNSSQNGNGSDGSSSQNGNGSDGSSPQNGNGSDGSSSQSNANFDQQILADIQQIEQALQQLTGEVEQLLEGNASSGPGLTSGGPLPGSGGSGTTSGSGGDPIEQQIASTDPVLGQMLLDMQNNGMSPSGYQQFEQDVSQGLQSGQYPDDQSLMNAALQEFTQQGGSSADQNIASSTISNDISQYGDQAVSTYGSTSLGGGDTSSSGSGSSGSDTGSGSGSGSGAGSTPGSSGDPIEQQIASTDPELGQMLLDMQTNGMSQSGYQQFEGDVSQALQSGQYPDDQSLMNSALQQFAQQAGSTADQNIASSTISNDISQYGDASVSTYNGTGSSSTTSGGGGGDTGTGGSGGSGGGDTGSGGGSTTTTADGQFQVENGQIIGPNGQPFVIKGMNVDAPGLSTAMDNASTLAKNWDVNEVRIDDYHNGIPIMDANGNPNFQELNQIVNTFTSQGMVVQLDGSNPQAGIFTGQSLAAQENFYQQAAAYYKNNPYVWFGTSNEAGGSNGNSPAWLAETTGEVSAIRGTGNTNPIVVDDTGWSNDSVSDPSQSGLLQNASTLVPYGNLIGAIHAYTDDQSGIAAGANLLKQAGYTPFVEEFGEAYYSNGWVDNPSDPPAVIANGQASGLGMAAYAVDPTAGPDDVMNPNGTPGSTFGQEVYNYYTGS